LAAAFAHCDADLTAHLDDLWALATAVATAIPAGDTRVMGSLDTSTNAINHERGRGWEVVFALAGWELRNIGDIRPEFQQALDMILAASGQMERTAGRSTSGGSRRWTQNGAGDAPGRSVSRSGNGSA
jgi:hypothetical protein